MKDNIYWLIFRRLKKKHPKWSKKQVGTVAYKVRCGSMIAIKDMEEMPKSCCEFHKDTDMIIHCPLYNSCDKRTTIKVNFKPIDCPLVEIVTCKDCKYNAYETKIKGDESIKIFCRKNKTYRCIDGFCSDGKRRE